MRVCFRLCHRSPGREACRVEHRSWRILGETRQTTPFALTGNLLKIACRLAEDADRLRTALERRTAA